MTQAKNVRSSLLDDVLSCQLSKALSSNDTRAVSLILPCIRDNNLVLSHHAYKRVSSHHVYKPEIFLHYHSLITCATGWRPGYTCDFVRCDCSSGECNRLMTVFSATGHPLLIRSSSSSMLSSVKSLRSATSTRTTTFCKIYAFKVTTVYRTLCLILVACFITPKTLQFS